MTGAKFLFFFDLLVRCFGMDSGCPGRDEGKDERLLQKATFRAKLDPLLAATLFVTLLVIGLILSVVVVPIRLVLKLIQGTEAKSRTVRIPLKVHEPEEGSFGSEARDTILLIHGFPDSGALWDTTVARLVRSGYRCVVIELPGSDGRVSSEGFGFEKVTEAIHDAVTGAGFDKVTIVGHDWGTLYTHLLASTYPNMVSRLVFCDVAPTSRPAFLDGICMFAYQLYFVVCFYLGDPIGALGVRLAAFLMGYRARPIGEITTDMLWPYPIMVSKALRRMISKKNENAENFPYKNRTCVPTMFAYGEKKQFYFHDLKFIEEVRSKPCGRVESLESDHWFMKGVPQQWLDILVSWLDESHSYMSKSSS